MSIPGSERPERWDFMTNHAHVLITIATRPPVRIRDIAEQVGITERATQRIVHDLVAAGYIERRRVGRRNEYTIHAGRPLRHPLQQHRQVGHLLALFCKERAEADARVETAPRERSAGLRGRLQRGVPA